MGVLREMVQSRSASECTVTFSSSTLFDVLIMLPNLISELPILRKGILSVYIIMIVEYDLFNKRQNSVVLSDSN